MAFLADREKFCPGYVIKPSDTVPDGTLVKMPNGERRLATVASGMTLVNGKVLYPPEVGNGFRGYVLVEVLDDPESGQIMCRTQGNGVKKFLTLTAGDLYETALAIEPLSKTEFDNIISNLLDIDLGDSTKTGLIKRLFKACVLP